MERTAGQGRKQEGAIHHRLDGLCLFIRIFDVFLLAWPYRQKNLKTVGDGNPGAKSVEGSFY